MPPTSPRPLPALLLLLVLSVALALPPVAAEGTQPGDEMNPGDCLVVAYVHDGGGHYSLLMNGTYLMGSTVTVVTDCPQPISVQVDAEPVVSGISGVEAPLPAGYPRIVQVWSNGTAVASWVNLSVYPGLSFTGTMLAHGEGDYWMEGALTMTADELSTKEVRVAVGAGIISFLVVSQILHRSVRSWTERNYCEEVVP